MNKYTKIAEMIKNTADKRKLDVRNVIRNWIELFEESRVVGFSREEFMDACIEAQNPKDDSLSSKRWGCKKENDWNYDEEELKEKIQNTRKRINEEIDNWMRKLGIFDSAELVNIPDVMDLVKEIDKIFINKFGKNLI